MKLQHCLDLHPLVQNRILWPRGSQTGSQRRGSGEGRVKQASTLSLYPFRVGTQKNAVSRAWKWVWNPFGVLLPHPASLLLLLLSSFIKALNSRGLNNDKDNSRPELLFFPGPLLLLLTKMNAVFVFGVALHWAALNYFLCQFDIIQNFIEYLGVWQTSTRLPVHTSCDFLWAASEWMRELCGMIMGSVLRCHGTRVSVTAPALACSGWTGLFASASRLLDECSLFMREYRALDDGPVLRTDGALCRHTQCLVIRCMKLSWRRLTQTQIRLSTSSLIFRSVVGLVVGCSATGGPGKGRRRDLYTASTLSWSSLEFRVCVFHSRPFPQSPQGTQWGSPVLTHTPFNFAYSVEMLSAPFSFMPELHHKIYTFWTEGENVRVYRYNNITSLISLQSSTLKDLPGVNHHMFTFWLRGLANSQDLGSPVGKQYPSKPGRWKPDKTKRKNESWMKAHGCVCRNNIFRLTAALSNSSLNADDVH